MTANEKLAELKNLISEYLDCMSFVPRRAVDCDQDEEQRLREAIMEKLEE